MLPRSLQYRRQQQHRYRLLALDNNTTGSNNIALGCRRLNVTTAITLSASATADDDVSDSCYISSIFGATLSGAPRFRESTTASSAHYLLTAFKEEIKPMDKASEALFALKPVTFRYKKEIDPEGTPSLALWPRTWKR